MDYQDEGKINKLRDIENIDYGKSIIEITSSMEIVLTLFQFDDDPEVIAASKSKLQEGIDLLKKFGADSEVEKFQV